MNEFENEIQSGADAAVTISRRRAVAAAAGAALAVAPAAAYAAPAVRELPVSRTAAFQTTGVVGNPPGGPNTGNVGGDPPVSSGGGVVGGVSEGPEPARVGSGEIVVSLPATGIGESAS